MCGACQQIMDYANLRLVRCPFQEGKTTCAKCPVHCYKPEMRARVREVMRYAGPRMLYRHPVLAVHHLLDGRRDQPIKKNEPAPQARRAQTGIGQPHASRSSARPSL